MTLELTLQSNINMTFQTYIAELRTPLVCIEWEKTFQTLAESDCSTAEKTSILQGQSHPSHW